MIARSAARRNSLGCGLPGCGLGVTPPISTKPNPRPSRPRTTSPCLSKPAARPIGFATSIPALRTGSAGGRRRRGENLRSRSAALCAFSGGSRWSSRLGNKGNNALTSPQPVAGESVKNTISRIDRNSHRNKPVFGQLGVGTSAHRPDRSKSAMTGAWSEGRSQPRASRSTSAPASAPDSAGVAQIWSSRRPRSEADQSRAR